MRKTMSPPMPRALLGRNRFWPVALCITALILILLGGALARHRSSTLTSAIALPPNGRWVPTALKGDITALLPEPRHPSVLLAASTNGVWRSADAGTTWQQDGSGMQGRGVFVLAYTTTSDAVWAGSFDGTVYLRTASTPVTWRRISPILLTDPSFGAVPVYSLAIAPWNRHPLLAGSLEAIFRAEPSADGHTWHWLRTWHPSRANANPGSGAITSLLVAPWNPQLVFASVFEANPPLLVSHDGGHTWAADTSGLPATLPVQDLAAGDPHTQQVFLTTMGGGVWQQSANGSWRDISGGLPQHHAMPLLLARPAAAGVLYAGTMGSGVYQKPGNGPWRPLGRGLAGLSATVLGLVQTSGPHPVLLAATMAGIFRYLPPA